MTGKFKYNPGDWVSPYEILMLERTWKAKDGHWYANFQCPYDNNVFKSRINSVAYGNV